MILSATELGAGPPVLLLHGLFGQSRNLAGLARALAPQFRTLALDLRNHGASPHAAGMDYPTLAADVLETARALDALPACVLGHSMGGKTAMALALLHPHAVSRLVVADIAPVRYLHHNRAVADAMLALTLLPGMTRREADAALAVPDAAVRGFLLQNLVLGEAPGWRVGLAEIAAGLADIEDWPGFEGQYLGPTLFVYGGASDFVLPEHRDNIFNLFPKAEFVNIEGAGHWLHAEKAEEFNKEVSSFLGKKNQKTFDH